MSFPTHSGTSASAGIECCYDVIVSARENGCWGVETSVHVVAENDQDRGLLLQGDVRLEISCWEILRSESCVVEK